MIKPKFYYEFTPPGHCTFQIQLNDMIYSIHHSNVYEFVSVNYSMFQPLDPTLPFDKEGYEKAQKECDEQNKKSRHNQGIRIETDEKIYCEEINKERAEKVVSMIMETYVDNDEYKQFLDICKEAQLDTQLDTTKVMACNVF